MRIIATHPDTYTRPMLTEDISSDDPRVVVVLSRTFPRGLAVHMDYEGEQLTRWIRAIDEDLQALSEAMT